MKHFLIFLLGVSLLVSCSLQVERETAMQPVDAVNPLMGTASTFEFSHGNTYPAVAIPWGLHAWSPQTGENGSGWMYTYADTLLRGFRQTHQPSPWINDYGTFSIMPLLGEPKTDSRERGVPFKHSNEQATPYCYRVKMDNGVTVALAPAYLGALLEITWPDTEGQYLVVDAYDRSGTVEVDCEEGFVRGISRYNNGGVPDNFANYFLVKFDQPIIEADTTQGGSIACIRFDLPPDEKLTVRTASSFISPEQAALNLERGPEYWSDLEGAANNARCIWNDLLGRIRIEGGTSEQRSTFYSCLYRTLLFPRRLTEEGSLREPLYYSPYDGQVHSYELYTDNGFWDTFRAVHPLFTLLYPEVSEAVLPSLLRVYEESGFLPEWASPGHRGCMIGNNSISIVTDAWLKGIRSVYADGMLEAMLHQTQARHPDIPSVGRDGYQWYDSLGYVPYPEVPEATAKTLEYAYADWCLARFAESLGRTDIAEEYYRKAQNYRNVFYPEKGFVWAKDAKGRWRKDFDATEWGGPFTEGSSWHWTWSVLHDPEGLARLMGGHEVMAARLDSMFAAPNTYNYGTYGFVIHEIAEMVALDMGQYAHGNQPVQHAIYLYDYVSQPWKAQQRVREVMDRLYNPGPAGYCGDEDNGQTSAWYVFSALGFYPVCPGTGQYVLGSPLFDKATLMLPNDRTFVIRADGNSPRNCYIRRAMLNGQELTRNYLTHDELLQGGELVLQMDSVPNTTRGTQPADFPYSYSKDAQR